MVAKHTSASAKYPISSLDPALRVLVASWLKSIARYGEHQPPDILTPQGHLGLAVVNGGLINYDAILDTLQKFSPSTGRGALAEAAVAIVEEFRWRAATGLNARALCLTDAARLVGIAGDFSIPSVNFNEAVLTAWCGLYVAACAGADVGPDTNVMAADYIDIAPADAVAAETAREFISSKRNDLLNDLYVTKRRITSEQYEAGRIFCLDFYVANNDPGTQSWWGKLLTAGVGAGGAGLNASERRIFQKQRMARTLAGLRKSPIGWAERTANLIAMGHNAAEIGKDAGYSDKHSAPAAGVQRADATLSYLASLYRLR